MNHYKQEVTYVRIRVAPSVSTSISITAIMSLVDAGIILMMMRRAQGWEEMESGLR